VFSRGRIETWKLLEEMILQKPLVGLNPFNQSFYENKMYSENEHVLMSWRYVLIGLLIYLSIFFIPLKKMWKERRDTNIQGILLILLMLVSALTNNPFTERNVDLLFCVGLAWVIGKEFKKEKDHAEV
jgi:O-antigen ligase